MRKIYSKLSVLAMLVCSLNTQAQQGNDFRIDTIADQEPGLLNLGHGVTVRAKESTAAISVITDEEIMQSSSINAYNVLLGKGLGMNLLQNGGTVWENNPTGCIRGINTLGNNGMLILVDGFERSLNLIVKEEIESVQILKDAAATALYGLKGANGVLYVTTKTGKRQGMDIGINYEYSYNSPSRLPKFANGIRYASAMNEALMNDGLSPMYDQTQLNGIKNGSPYYGNVNWMDEVLRNTGSTNNLSMTLRGGGRIANYFAVVDYVDNRGFIQPRNVVDGYSSQHKYSKLNVRTNLNVQLTKSTELVYKMSGMLAEHNRPGILSSDLISLLYNTPSAAFPVQTPYGDWGGSDIWKRNPVAEVAAQGYGRSHQRTLLADMALKQSLEMFVKGLTVDVRLGYDNFAEYWDTYGMKYSYAVPTVSHPSQSSDYVKKGESTAASFSSSLGMQWSHFNVVGRINYSRLWNKVHQLNATAAVSTEQEVFSGQHNTRNRINLVGHAHYAYDGKYIADLAFSRHGSNQLAPDNRFGNFPALSAAWVVSNESFMKSVSFLDLLKVRGSWGVSGRDIAPAALLWRQQYGWANGYILGGEYGGASGLGEGRIPSTQMTYEKTTKINLGLDASLFNTVDLTLELFKEKTNDILITSGEISSVIGVALPYGNFGKVDNKGIEMGLNVHREFKDFKFNVGGNFTFSRNKIIEMGEDYKPYEWMKNEGQSVGQLFGYEAIGFFKDTKDIADSPKQNMSTVKPGDIKFKDLNKDGFIDVFDQKPIGSNSLMPEINYAVSLGVEYKGIGVDALFQGVGNYSTITSTSSLFWPLSGNTTISDHYYENRWTPDHQDAKYPRLSQGTNANNFNNNTVWLTDRSYIKLRHAELYYKFSKNMLASTPLKSLKVYARASDVILFDHIKVCDPEALGAVYPIATSLQFGVCVGF